jgi:hypothetical protein
MLKQRWHAACIAGLLLLLPVAYGRPVGIKGPKVNITAEVSVDVTWSLLKHDPGLRAMSGADASHAAREVVQHILPHNSCLAAGQV